MIILPIIPTDCHLHLHLLKPKYNGNLIDLISELLLESMKYASYGLSMCSKHLDNVLSGSICGAVSTRDSSRNWRYSGEKNDSLCPHRSYIPVRKLDKNVIYRWDLYEVLCN